jgi:uncharacterized protein YneF (UPF0154 family)
MNHQIKKILNSFIKEGLKVMSWGLAFLIILFYAFYIVEKNMRYNLEGKSNNPINCKISLSYLKNITYFISKQLLKLYAIKSMLDFSKSKL